jgi:cobalt-zinc-cadmium efflux system outer membrane protein
MAALVGLNLTAAERAVAQAIADSPLTLDGAVSRALTDNPELRAAGLAVDIERLRRDSAALPPPLALNAEIENFAGSGVSAGLSNSEVTVTVSRLIERGNQTELRRQIGQQRVMQAATAAQSAQLSMARRVTQRFIDILALQERLSLAQRRADIARQTLDIVTARMEVGRSLEADQVAAIVTLSRAELAATRYEEQLDAARMLLASLWGAASPALFRADGDLYTLPAIGEFEALVTRLDSNPDLLRRAAELDLREAERRLAAANASTDLSLAGGLRHLGQPDDVGLVFSVRVPFGNRSRAQPEIDAARLRTEQSPLATEAQRRELRAQLYVLLQELDYARTALSELRGSIIPEAERAVALYDEAFVVGSSTLLDLVESQNRLIELSMEALATAALYHSTLADVRFLLGGNCEVTS